MREWSSNGLALLLGCAIALVLCEVGSRIARPIGAGVERVTDDGDRLRGWLPAGRVYRQVSSEFDVQTTVTDTGYRAPAVEGNPDVVFLGDSFTFGWGLGDGETFAALYCAEVELSCANLGVPGTGTVDQVDRLARYLDEQSWRPAEVKLFMFAMTASFSAGNDLLDNYDAVRRSTRRAEKIRQNARSASEEVAPGIFERLMNQRRLLLRHSNLLRLVKFYWGPALRSTLVPKLDRVRLEEALEITRVSLERLDELSIEYDFDYSVYLIHPVQDILRSTHRDTLRRLDEISPTLIHATAPLFEASPKRFFYTFDGHINREGSRRIAEMLISAARAS